MSGDGTTTHRHASELGSWLVVQRAPAAALRPYIAPYTGYREDTRRFGRHLQAASSHVPLIVNLGAPYRIDGPSARDATRSSFVAGLHDGPTLVGADGCQHCLQVDFSPLGARRILGVPMRQLSNQVIELGDLFGERQVELLVERLRATPDWETRFDILDTLLLDRLQRGPEIPPGILHAWELIERRGASLPIRELARELGWSNKHLIALFREHIGLPPKTLARVLRFERAARLMRRDDDVCLASVAQAAGYFDQAHLHRDVRQFAGITPGMFLRQRIADMDGLIAD